MSTEYAGMALSVLCALFWASAVIFFKRSGEEVGPLSLNFIKNCISVVLYTLTLPLLSISFIPNLTMQQWLVTALSGILGIGMGDAFFFAALNRLGASRIAVVDCLYNPSMIILSVIFLGEPFSLAMAIGTIMVLCGLALTLQRKSLKPTSAESGPREIKQVLTGVVYGISGIVSMAASIVMIKPMLGEIPVFWVIWWRMIWGFLALFAWMAIHPRRFEFARKLTGIKSWRFVLPGVIVGGYFATIAWLYGMSLTNVSVASVLNQLSTIFIIILAAVFLKEKPDRKRIIAAFLGFGGACVIFLRHFFPF